MMSHKTRAQRQRLRWSCQCWYPRANDLQLPDVPAGDRAEVRRILSWLGKLPVRGGTCWQTSQAVTLLARDSRVQYVEGAHWNTKNEAGHAGPISELADGTLECSSVCKCKPLPHAWNTVNGHVVDLLEEFHNWRFGGEWLHEPSKTYSVDDLLSVAGSPGNFSITQKAWMEQHQDHETQSMAAICQRTFKEA